MRRRSLIYSFLILIFGLLLLPSCQKEDLPIKISQISKPDRERLGDEILAYIEEDSEICNVLFKEDYPVVFEYIQKLYNHAAYFPKEDLHSSSFDRWNRNREWRVVIVDQDNVKAFCMPGGHLVVSTGLLKKIKYEFELFYVMNFEIALMNQKYLLKALVQTVKNPEPVLEIAYGRTSGELDRDSLGRALSKIDYGLLGFSMRKLDSLACYNICKNSMFSNQGFLDLYPNKFSDEDIWLSTRPNYRSRITFLENYGEINSNLNCSDSKWGNKGARYFRDSIISRLPL